MTTDKILIAKMIDSLRTRKQVRKLSLRDEELMAQLEERWRELKEKNEGD